MPKHFGMFHLIKSLIFPTQSRKSNYFKGFVVFFITSLWYILTKEVSRHSDQS